MAVDKIRLASLDLSTNKVDTKILGIEFAEFSVIWDIVQGRVIYKPFDLSEIELKEMEIKGDRWLKIYAPLSYWELVRRMTTVVKDVQALHYKRFGQYTWEMGKSIVVRKIG